MAFPTSLPLQFGVFEFDLVSGDLRKHGLRVRLTPQATMLLRILAESPNQIHTREEIQRRLWPGNTFVDFDHSLNKIVHSLREALGESARSPRFIDTVASGGYRLLLPSLEPAPAPTHLGSAGAVMRLAVLPVCGDGDAELASMGKTITWVLTERLAVLPGIRVMAESTIKRYQPEAVNPQQMGAHLGVEAVLAGELARQDGRLVLKIEIVDALDGALLGGVMLECEWQSGAHCEKDLAQEAYRRIRSLLPPSCSRKPVRRVVLPERDEKAS